METYLIQNLLYDNIIKKRKFDPNVLNNIMKDICEDIINSQLSFDIKIRILNKISTNSKTPINSEEIQVIINNCENKLNQISYNLLGGVKKSTKKPTKKSTKKSINSIYLKAKK